MAAYTGADLCAAMRSAGVSSVWLAQASSSGRLSNFVQVCADLPLAFKAPSVFLLDPNTPQLVTGLLGFSLGSDVVRIDDAEGIRLVVGSGRWSLGTLATRTSTTGSREFYNTRSYNRYWSPKELTITSTTAPRTGYVGSVFRTDSELQTVRNSLSNARRSLASCESDLAAVAGALKSAASRAPMLARVVALTAAAERAGRIVYTHRLRSIRIGRY